jgi:hypothetical protein
MVGLAKAGEGGGGMTLGGWALLVCSWTVIIALFVYCLYRTIRQGKPPRIETEAMEQQHNPTAPQESTEETRLDAESQDESA